MVIKPFTIKYSKLNDKGKKELLQLKVKASNVKEAREKFNKELGDQLSKVEIISIQTIGG